MLRAPVVFISAIAVWLSFATCVSAAPSGLILIPTADIVEPGHYCPSLTSESSEDLDTGNSAFDFSLENQFGVLPHVEAGYDYSFTEKEGVGNVKVGYPLSRASAIAVGLQGINDDNQWYVAYSTEITKAQLRLHAGALGPFSSTAPFVGVELPVKNQTFTLEGIGGSDKMLAVGYAIPLYKEYEGVAGVIFPQHGRAQLSLEIGCELSFMHGHSEQQAAE